MNAPRETNGDGAEAHSPAAEKTPDADEMALLIALRQGDEAAFMLLVDRYHPSLVRLALMYVQDHATAEDIAQEAWLGVLNGIKAFEGRSSLKTWIFRIVTNIAKTRAVHEGKTIPFSNLALQEESGFDEPAVAPDRFFPPDHPQWPGKWVVAPVSWANVPEERLLSAEMNAMIIMAIMHLPPNQRVVITLRDIEGWDAGEVSQFLNITKGYQRVLLHRARSKVRHMIESYLKNTET